MKTIYIAGPLLNESQENIRAWRDRVIKELKDQFSFIDPSKQEFQLPNELCQLVESDKENIDKSDIILVNHTRPSDGTAMEILYAYMKNKIIIVIKNDFPIDKKELSPWIYYHSDQIYYDLDSTIRYLKNSVYAKKNLNSNL